MQLKFTAYFTQGKLAKTHFKWKQYTCNLAQINGQGQILKVSAPSSWSPLAVSMAAAKYFRKTNVAKTGMEKSVLQMINRVVDTIVASGVKQKYFQKGKTAEIFREELKYILLSQKAFFNSPVWFNCGLYESYGIKNYKSPQVSACFIQSVQDSLQSIYDLLKSEALLFKYGSGSGTNFSNLRAENELLSGGGTSSGLMSFLQIFDASAGAIKSGGTTRRAAKMVCLDIDHPDILQFIRWKAHNTTAGRNSNNSVRVPNQFFIALKKSQNWNLRARTSKYIAKIPAKDLWQEIAKATWQCADPGVQFSDNIDAWNTCAYSGKIRASNPCSEFMFLDDTACNLASLNLKNFLDEKNQFDFVGFVHVVKILITAQDILVDYAGYPTQKITENSKRFRPLGLGFCGLGAFFLKQGIAYDSDLARDWASHLSALLTGEAYLQSIHLARLKTPFFGYKKNKKSMLEVIKKHHHAIEKNISKKQNDFFTDYLYQLWKVVLNSGKKYGFRNSQVTLMAPTGTIGLVLDADTTGIEPEFSFAKIKYLEGGGQIHIPNQTLYDALKFLNYSENDVENILQYVNENGSLQNNPTLRKEHLPIFKTAQEIPAQGHLLMMAAIQPFISGAISKTINLPEHVTEDEIADIYLQAWKLSLKSISIYRNHSKLGQPLRAVQTIKCLDC